MERRHSKKRELVLEILRKTNIHPTAEWIYERAREIDPSISLGTVYRNLGFLCENGFAVELEMADKKMHYDGVVKDHDHFFCKECGSIHDVMEKIESFPKQLTDNGFEIERESCIYYGICPECAKKLKQENNK